MGQDYRIIDKLLNSNEFKTILVLVNPGTTKDARGRVEMALVYTSSWEEEDGVGQNTLAYMTHSKNVPCTFD
jgi:hypothetical protein